MKGDLLRKSPFSVPTFKASGPYPLFKFIPFKNRINLNNDSGYILFLLKYDVRALWKSILEKSRKIVECFQTFIDRAQGNFVFLAILAWFQKHKFLVREGLVISVAYGYRNTEELKRRETQCDRAVIMSHKALGALTEPETRSI